MVLLGERIVPLLLPPPPMEATKPPAVAAILLIFFAGGGGSGEEKEERLSLLLWTPKPCKKNKRPNHHPSPSPPISNSKINNKKWVHHYSPAASPSLAKWRVLPLWLGLYWVIFSSLPQTWDAWVASLYLPCGKLIVCIHSLAAVATNGLEKCLRNVTYWKFIQKGFWDWIIPVSILGFSLGSAGILGLKGCVAERKGEREEMQDAHVLLNDISEECSPLPSQMWVFSLSTLVHLCMGMFSWIMVVPRWSLLPFAAKKTEVGLALVCCLEVVRSFCHFQYCVWTSGLLHLPLTFSYGCHCFLLSFNIKLGREYLKSMSEIMGFCHGSLPQTAEFLWGIF